MKTLNAAPVLERFVGSLSECSTAGTGRQFAALKADHELRAGIDYVTGRCNLGLLTALEEVVWY